jgi:hypothetical protein
VRHFVGIGSEILSETTDDLAIHNTKGVTANFNNGTGRLVITHETTRRELGARWQVKDTRKIKMWLQVALCNDKEVLAESEMQEIVFRNGILRDNDKVCTCTKC